MAPRSLRPLNYVVYGTNCGGKISFVENPTFLVTLAPRPPSSVPTGSGSAGKTDSSQRAILYGASRSLGMAPGPLRPLNYIVYGTNCGGKIKFL